MTVKKPVFEVGQLVVATGSYNWLLTEGKQYVVIKYEPEQYAPIFTWPAYVTVIGDSGKPRGSARGSSEQAGTACGATSVASGQLACEVQQGQPHQPLPTAMLLGE